MEFLNFFKTGCPVGEPRVVTSSRVSGGKSVQFRWARSGCSVAYSLMAEEQEGREVKKIKERESRRERKGSSLSLFLPGTRLSPPRHFVGRYARGRSVADRCERRLDEETPPSTVLLCVCVCRCTPITHQGEAQQDVGRHPRPKNNV